MTQKHTGWIIGIAGLGMLLHLLSGDVGSLNNWHEALYPAFVRGVMEHFATVITAFIGGNLVPNLFKDDSNQLSDEHRNEISKIG